MSANLPYWIVFTAGFLGVALWESSRPRTRPTVSTERRWAHHAVLFAVSAALQTAAVRLFPAWIAALWQGSRFGLLNQAWLPGYALRFTAAVLLLDLVKYWTHRAYHSRLILWRVHEVHHCDPDYDVSTATRFHPLDVIPTQAAVTAAVLLLAPPPLAVLTSELLSLVVNLESHANAALPEPMERAVRTVFVTPDLHRIHHSEDPLDQGRNFGQTFSFWDRLFGTYADAGASGPVVTGVRGTRGDDLVRARRLLGRPFRRA